LVVVEVESQHFEKILQYMDETIHNILNTPYFYLPTFEPPGNMHCVMMLGKKIIEEIAYFVVFCSGWD